MVAVGKLDVLEIALVPTVLGDGTPLSPGGTGGPKLRLAKCEAKGQWGPALGPRARGLGAGPAPDRDPAGSGPADALILERNGADSGAIPLDVEATLTVDRAEGNGLRVAGAGRDEARRLVAGVRRFHGESGHELDPAQAGAVLALCADPSLGRAWLLTDGRRDAGYALAYWRHSIDHGGRVAVLDDLRIEPGLRGRGLGARLLREALAGMSEAGARAVVVEADPADAPAMAFYRRFGFAPKGTALLVRTLPPASAPIVGGR